MAASTLNGSMQSGQPESGGVVIKSGWFPGCGGMAAAATGPQTALVSIIFEMTGHASGWGPLKQPRNSVAF
jgi:hypothetical protein